MNKHIFSIKTYALFFMVFIILLFAVHGAVSYLDLQHLKEDFSKSHREAAINEIRLTLNNLEQKIKQQTQSYSGWDEITQQLNNPAYYAYWHNHRAMTAGNLPEYFIDIALYNQNGKVLAVLDTSLMDKQITPQSDGSFYEINQQRIEFITIQAIKDFNNPEQAIGYLATRSEIFPTLFKQSSFDYLDAHSIEVISPNKQFNSTEKLLDIIKFNIRKNDYGDKLVDAMNNAIFRMSLVIVFISLLLYPLIAFLVGKPLLAISKHIDFLQENTASLILPPFMGRLGVAELEKVRESLNEYHGNLIQVHSNLEDKNRELNNLAHHDHLTGAGNRLAFEEQWTKVKDIFANSRCQLCLIIYDVNHFKPFNDTYGHQIGDEVLKIVTQAIRKSLRKGEIVYRLGGDEFATIHLNTDQQSCLKIAERCQQAITESPLSQFGIDEPIRISMGIASVDAPNNNDLSDMLWQADIAMYSAKQPGQSYIAVYNEEMSKSSRGLFSSWINNAVYEALDNGVGITMHYQPIVNLEKDHIEYYEALVRILRDGELISPLYIFQLVESRRLEVDMDLAIFKQIKKDLLKHKIPDGSGVSINVSGPGIINTMVIDELASFVPFLQSHKIVLEITETSLITQIEKASEHIKKLQAMGFIIALDDFGSGYSSLSYLATMPVDIVKFDISLIRCLNTQKQQNLIKHLATMIRETGHLLLAEGIENPDLDAKIRSLKFNYGQGYFYGKPEQQLQAKLPAA